MYNLLPIFSQIFSLTTLTRVHFIPQLEMQAHNMTLPTTVTFSCNFVVAVPKHQLPKFPKTCVKSHKISHKTSKNLVS